MTPAEWALILTALLGGGALWKMIESVLVAVLHKGKTAREEFREEMARLEARVAAQEKEIALLKQEVAARDEKAIQLREMNLSLKGIIQRMEISIEAKDATIVQLEQRMRRLQKAVQCKPEAGCALMEHELEELE